MSRTKCAKGTEVLAELVPDTKSGTPSASAIKVEGVITWVGVADALKAEVRLYDRLFSVPQPDTGEKDFLEELNPDSLKVVTAYVESSLASAKGDEKFQFESMGTLWRIGRTTYLFLRMEERVSSCLIGWRG